MAIDPIETIELPNVLEHAPRLDQRSGTQIAVRTESDGFDMPFLRGLAEHQIAAYDDLVGPHIGSVMQEVGWYFIDEAVRVDAWAADAQRLDSTSVIGSAWAALIRMKDTGKIGLNLSYGIAQEHAGRGLARLLAACAALECMAAPVHPLMQATFVNIQARSTNLASLAVARSLGVPNHPAAAFRFDLPDGSHTDYVGFREPILPFRARMRAMVSARVEGYTAGCLTADMLAHLEAKFEEEELGRATERAAPAG